MKNIISKRFLNGSGIYAKINPSKVKYRGTQMYYNIIGKIEGEYLFYINNG